MHAGVVIGTRNRKGLERLCRYIARPPLAKSRLEQRPDGSVRLLLKRPWSDGSVAIAMTRLELVERLAALVPPPHKNQVLRIGSIRPLFKLRTLCARDTSHQSLVQTATYPTEFEPQIPSNSASAPSQAHLPMPLTQSGRSSIQPLHRPPVVLYMQPDELLGANFSLWMAKAQHVHRGTLAYVHQRILDQWPQMGRMEINLPRNTDES